MTTDLTAFGVGIPGQGEGPPMKAWYILNEGHKTMIDWSTESPGVGETTTDGGTGHAMPSPDSGTEDSHLRRRLTDETPRHGDADLLHTIIRNLENCDINGRVRILKALWHYFHMDSQ